MIEKEQELLALALDRLAQQFDKHAILKGGMVLRVLGSPRLTNDLDYVFVPYQSKKDILEDVVACLESIEGASVHSSLNSKSLRIVLERDGTKIQIEASVAMEMETSTLSTRLFSPRFNLPPRIINVVEYRIALANKMAAWNERRLVRDIYDIWFFLQMGILPDPATLEKRLAKPEYSKLVKAKDYFLGKTCEEFYDFLREHAANLTDDRIEKELADYLEPDELVGLSAFFRAALAKLR